MDWKNGYTEEAMIAQVQVAPATAVGEIIERYRRSLTDEDSRYVFAPFNASDDLEKSIFARNDPYLNLLLAGTVTDSELAKALWDLSEATQGSTDEWRNSVKHLLLQGHALTALIKEGRWGDTPTDGKISLTELLSHDDFNSDYARLVLSNPYSKGLLKKILLRQGTFAIIPEKNLPIFLHYIALNKALNLDSSNSDGPDLAHWDLRKAVEETLKVAPTTPEWFYGISALVDALEQKAFPFYDFPIEEFAANWLKFKSKRRFSSSDDDDNEEPAGYYTSLTETEEFVSLFCAKFGSWLVKDKNLKVSEALKLESLIEKSAYFGNKYLSKKEVEESLNGADPNIVFWLLHNDTVLRNSESRQIIKEYVGDGARGWLLKKRVDYQKQIYPDSFLGETSSVNDTQSEEFTQLSETISFLARQTNFIVERVNKAEGSLKAIGYGLAFLVAIFLLKSCG
jgi:hypothetical protein